VEQNKNEFSPDEIVELARQNPGATAQMHHVANSLLYLSTGIFNNSELIRLLDSRLKELTAKHNEEVKFLKDEIDLLRIDVMKLSGDEGKLGLN
jgi:hypothetical protein